MNWRNLILVVALSLSSTLTFAQSNLLNAKTPDQIGKKTEAEQVADNDKPMPYGYVHDRDILMGKRTWEIIDLDERVNFPLYFPVEGDLGPDRKPLYKVLIDAMKDGRITEIENETGIRFPFSVGQLLQRNVEVWACNNNFLMDGKDTCPDKKIFGIKTKDVPQGHEWRHIFPHKF